VTNATPPHLQRLARVMGKSRLERLLALATRESLPSETVLIEDGKTVDSLWLLDDGVCRVELQAAGRSLQLGRLGSGQWLGEVSMLTGEAASASVIAETRLALHRWPHETIQTLRRDEPEVAGALVRSIIQVLMERVRASDAEIQHEADRLLLRGSDRVTHRAGLAERSWLRKALERLLGTSGSPAGASSTSLSQDGATPPESVPAADDPGSGDEVSP